MLTEQDTKSLEAKLSLLFLEVERKIVSECCNALYS